MEQKHPIAWHVPNLINICIDSVEDGEMTGKIYHCYSEEAIKSAWGVDVSVNDDETVMSLQ